MLAADLVISKSHSTAAAAATTTSTARPSLVCFLAVKDLQFEREVFSHCTTAVVPWHGNVS
jgi:hypothetical protein